MQFLRVIPLIFVIACMEQGALARFNQTADRLCVTAPTELSVDQYLSKSPQGCVLVSLKESLAAGLNEVGVTQGVYHTQATSLSFTHYLDEVVIARYGDTLAIMTPAAFRELAQAAGAVKEAHLEEQQLREGKGLVIFGSLQAIAPAEPRQLTPDQVILLRKGL